MMNEILTEKIQQLAPVVLRIGLSLVILWFGSQQLLYTDNWTSLIPDMVTNLSGVDASFFVLFNGAFEIIFGLCLLAGFQTRIVSLLLALHMLLITVTVGYSATGVRDFGLAIAAISSFMYGVDTLSLDHYLEKRSKI